MIHLASSLPTGPEPFVARLVIQVRDPQLGHVTRDCWGFGHTPSAARADAITWSTEGEIISTEIGARECFATWANRS